MSTSLTLPLVTASPEPVAALLLSFGDLVDSVGVAARSVGGAVLFGVKADSIGVAAMSVGGAVSFGVKAELLRGDKVASGSTLVAVALDF